LVLVATLVLYLAGAANDSQPAYTFASALLGILLATYVLSRLAASGLQVLRASVPECVMADSASPLRIWLANAALIAKPRARLSFRLVSLFFEDTAAESSFRVPPLPPRLRVNLEVPLFVPWRGKWRIVDLRLEGSDPLGLFQRRERTVEPMQFLAIPPYWLELPVSWSALLAPATRLMMTAERTELGEYRTVREYTPGDDIRHVHWRATAHRGKLSVKEYDRPREIQAQVWLVPVGQDGVMVPDAELAVSIAATLAHTFARAPMPTVLRALGLPPDIQGPGEGELFWRQLVSALAEVPYVPGGDVTRQVANWSYHVPPGATVYLVSNSIEALVSMVDVQSSYSQAITILAGADRSGLLRPQVTIREYNAIPAALAELAQTQVRKVVPYGV